METSPLSGSNKRGAMNVHSSMPSPESIPSPRKPSITIGFSKGTGVGDLHSFRVSTDIGGESPKTFHRKIVDHRKMQEKLTLPIQVETKNLMKFERQFADIVTKRRRNQRYN